jgi:dTDP-4-amino-4,6-dideoxygalactose transaminase
VINVPEISITRTTTLREALAILDRAGTGILLLVNETGSFERTVTDGDLRRLILTGCELDGLVGSLPSAQSVVVEESTGRRAALTLMNSHGINHLPVLDLKGEVIRVLERREIDEQILLSTPHMGDFERNYVEDAFRSNWIAPLGPNVDSFEQELAAVVGVKHAAALSSGTAAIHLALRLLGVGFGDRVFCSTLTFVASANPIVYQGAEAVFIDSDDASWNMSPAALEKAFDWAHAEGRLPKAVIVVNLYGQSADMNSLTEICDRYGVPVIEDAAESLGARYRGKASGSFGALGIYSFNGNKIITTSGGGMIVSDNAALIQRARHLATQAREPVAHYEHTEVGYNYRMSNVLAGIGRGQLKVLSQRVLARRAVFQQYRDSLRDLEALIWMPEPEWSYSTHWLSACTLNPAVARFTRTQLIQKLAAEMIEARPLWKPMHLQPLFQGCKYFPHGSQSISDALFEHGLCLPSGSNMAPGTLERVIDVMRRCLTI